MNYSAYLKMTSIQLDDEITKQKQKIKNINETIVLLKKLKIAAEISEKDQTSKTEKQKTDQVVKTETLQSSVPKSTGQQPVKPQNQQPTQPQQSQQQKPKLNAGGILNGIRH